MKTICIVLLTSLLGLATLLGITQGASAQVQRAIHATQDEINIWKQRAVSGPYKDEWDIIKSNANAFVAKPDARWPGKTTNACYSAEADGDPSRTLDRGLRDAAFVYLVTGQSSYRDAARAALIAQKNITGTDWSNQTRWCRGGPGKTNSAAGNGFKVGIWIRKLVYAYSYIRSSLSTTDQNALDAWFREAGYLFESGVHSGAATRFPKRYNDDYAKCVGSNCPGSDEGILYYGGPMTKAFHRAWENRASANAALVAAIGVLLDDEILKNHAKRYVHEWLAYAVWPGGVLYDERRWQTGGINPQRGFSYLGTAIGSILTIADHLGRAGDTSLFTYSTNDGMYGSEGGPKTLLKVLQHFAGVTNGTIINYASKTSTTNTDLIIDPSGPFENGERIEYVYLANNSYYQDPDVKKAYTRPLPKAWDSSGYDHRNGDWGSYPSIRFMFGQQEGKVWPYLEEGQNNRVTPEAPKRLRSVSAEP